MSDIEQRLREAMDALVAIAEGYSVRGEADRFVIVENPKFREDDGSDPNICIDTFELRAAARKKADTIASLRSKLEEAEGALERLLNAKALSNVRSLVAGWNGEDRPDGPFKERHPSRLGARIETNCGRVYELDEAMQDARRTLASLREADHA